MAELEIIIEENGEIKTHIEGIKGSGCANIVKALEAVMGNASKAEKTADYYKSNESLITPTR